MHVTYSPSPRFSLLSWHALQIVVYVSFVYVCRNTELSAIVCCVFAVFVAGLTARELIKRTTREQWCRCLAVACLATHWLVSSLTIGAVTLSK